MEKFKQRRETILNIFAQAKVDLEQLNKDIDDQISFNQSVITDKMNENKELESLKGDNSGSIKTFAKFLK